MRGDSKHFDGAASHGSDHATTRDVLVKERTGDLPVPYAELSGVESIATGYRQQMFDLKDENGDGGGVATGAGLGTDFITLQWNDKTAIVRGLDLLRAWVSTFAPEEAKHFPKGLAESTEQKSYGFTLRPSRKDGRPNMGRKPIRDIFHAASRAEAVEMALTKWKGYAIEEQW